MTTPYRYDTEVFYFHYESREDCLRVKIKNESTEGSKVEEPYALHYGANGVTEVEIHGIFHGEERFPFSTHTQKLGQFFMPWFKINRDCRVELERGIRRFYALNAYEVLDKGARHFGVVLDNAKTTLAGITERLPRLFDERNALADRLTLNYQDKGASTGRGSTIFDTKQMTWVLYETGELHPEKPEYLWAVAHFTPAFRPECGYDTFVTYLGENPATNAKCFDYIMDAQRILYEVCPIDLDKKNQAIEQVEGVVTQLELILDIHGAESVLGHFFNNGRPLSEH